MDNVLERLKLGYTLEESVELREDEIELKRELVGLRAESVRSQSGFISNRLVGLVEKGNLLHRVVEVS